MRDEVKERIGHLYPPAEVTVKMARERPSLKPYVGQKLTVIAWIWARTVTSQNPAFRHVDVPPASTLILSRKAGKEAYVEPVIKDDTYRFTVKTGKLPSGVTGGTTASKRSAFRCLMSSVPVDYNHIRSEGKAGRMDARLMALVAEGQRGRIYYFGLINWRKVAAAKAQPKWRPNIHLPGNRRDFKTLNYGLRTSGDLLTRCQLIALTTFSDLITEAGKKIFRDAVAAGLLDDQKGLDVGGSGARPYAEAVGVYSKQIRL